MEAYHHEDVALIFETYPPALRARLMRLRQLIFDGAAAIGEVGALEETLKWGQPSYLTPVCKSGTIIGLDHIKNRPDQYGMFVHCQTNLVQTYRELYGDVLTFDGNRGIRWAVEDDVQEDVVSHCVALALTYHRTKKP